MVSRSELARLRAAAEAAQKRAARKVARIEAKGIRIAGTSLAPKIVDVSRLNSRQLNSLIGRVEEFNSRKTQFVKASNNDAIPIQEWRRYKAAERKVNQKKAAFNKRIKGITTIRGLTIEQETEMRKTTLPTLKNHSSVLHPLSRTPASARSRKDLQKYIKKIEKMAKSDFINKQVTTTRKTWFKMIAKLPEGEELRALAKDLTDSQWMVLAQESGFIDSTAIRYLAEMNKISGNHPATRKALESQSEFAINDIKKWIKWGKNLDI